MLSINTNLNQVPTLFSPATTSLASSSAYNFVLNQQLIAMYHIMASLIDQVAHPQAGLAQAAGFGGRAQLADLGSTLKDFLGFGSKGDTAPKVRGEKIPGGKSLYSGKGMYHKGAPGAPDTYAFENSPAGIKFAAKHGYKSIDIDMQITKDGVPVATHWAQPLKKDGFYDPLGKIDKNAKVKDLTLAEVIRLRNKDGQSQIYPVETMIKLLKENGIAGDFEAKNDARFASDEIMGNLANMVRAAGIQANLKSVDRGDGTEKILRKAQEHGFWTRIALDPKPGHKKYWGYGN